MYKRKKKPREKRRRLLFYRCMNEGNCIFPVNRADVRIPMDVGNEFRRNKLLLGSNHAASVRVSNQQRKSIPLFRIIYNACDDVAKFSNFVN